MYGDSCSVSIKTAKFFGCQNFIKGVSKKTIAVEPSESYQKHLINQGHNCYAYIDDMKKDALKYLNIFKDHPYIFNLGHGVLPQTKPETVDYLVKLVKDFK